MRDRHARTNLRRVRRILLAPLAAVALLAGLLPTIAPPAQAAPLLGHDISWPQCPSSVGGFDLPLPPDSTQFVIVGLTKGLPFTENPCLASQVDWVQDRSKPAHGYAMAAFPTSAQLSTYGSQGPWSTTTRAGQLSNVGYAEAKYAVATLARIGWRPPVVWIDVEPRPAQPWPSSSAAQRLENRYVVEGLMRGLRDNGYAYGLYSYANGWQEITGGWRLPGVPVWATAGRLDYPDEALDRCTQASFSGGRVYLSQWYDDTRDYDRTCGTYAFSALAVPASTLSNSTADFNGDWNNDVLARRSSDATLNLYPGRGNGRLASRIQIGTGWGSFSALETVGDFSGDGALDVLAREAATGYLWMYRSTGKGGWSTRVRVGTGWNPFNAIIGPGDFDGDQRVDVLARRASTGELFLYAGNGSGGWKGSRRVGTGWNVFNRLIGAGDVNGDGRADVLARESSTGYLWLYPGNGSGGWLPRVRIGTGWNGMTAISSPGDLTGDRVVDVVARDRNGDLWLYARTASGGWRTRVLIGTGWNGINAIF
ncbi:MAG TPA: FG-GAP-like repeat-containing protein [Nocardioides sp.]|uniref:FG-GAP-like repeat-containing protein n=1 Tax=Nocardioides sp. TaxID=35761 RepID=UPI002D8116CF|nr:FG-GAP-like repeat-containing protein [Nocardioides sp.]HET6653397.1 FG-GAP-like repeat-containing protein [Nocardioides sp.]